MIWSRREYKWDGEIRHCWISEFPFGEMCVDYADWIDADNPWITYWYPPNCSDGIEIADRHGNKLRADADSRGMVVAEEWLRWQVTGTENALARVNQPVDEE